MSSEAQHSLQSISDYYLNDVTDALALAYKACEKFPIEVLNEVRSAFTHVARAQASDGDNEAFESELSKARSHLLRCNLDCAKLCLLNIAGKLDDDMEALVHSTEFPRTIKEEADALRNRRHDVSVREAIAADDQVVEIYWELVRDYNDFRDELVTEYGKFYVDATKEGLAQRLAEKFTEGQWSGRRQTWITALVLGILGSMLGALILNFLEMQILTLP